MSSLTPFQKEKIARVFTLLYDMDNDGFIEENDFDLYLKKICKILDWQENGPKHTTAKSTLHKVWNGLLEIADTNRDKKVSKEEWLTMWAGCLGDIEKGEFPDWQKQYMDLMFDVNDKSGDDFIDVDEYTTFFTRFNISEEACRKAFKSLSGEEFGALVIFHRQRTYKYFMIFTVVLAHSFQVAATFSHKLESEKISRDSFAKLWREYLTSNDPAAPGNSLFGPDLD